MLPRSLYMVCLVLASAVATGCGSPGAKSPGGASSPAQATQENVAAEKVPAVKYAAAILFEGGKGDSWFRRPGEGHTPLWRYYICLPQTADEITGELSLDLLSLGTPVEARSVYSHSQQLAFVERLHKVTLKYRASATLTIDEAAGYGSGRAWVKMTSEQPWENSPQFAKVDRSTIFHQDLELFNFETNSGTAIQFNQYKYQLNGEDHYISSRLLTFDFSASNNISSKIEACEKADRPEVLEQGEKLTPLAIW